MLRSVDDTFQDIEVIYASNDLLKASIYKLRHDIEKQQCDQLLTKEQVIDERDIKAHNILLRSNKTRQTLASIRLYQNPHNKLFGAGLSKAPQTANKLEPLVLGNPLSSFNPQEYCIVDRLYIRNDNAISISDLTLVLHLAAFCFARLMFYKFVICYLTCEDFKLLRSKGFLLEQTSYSLLGKQDNYFYAITDDGISQTSSSWEIYQHLLGELAYQINKPDVEAHNTGIKFARK